MQTNQASKIYNLLGLGEYTTAEMFNLNARVGDIIFNTTIQSIVQYTNEGWKNMLGNLVLNQLFFEDFESGNFTQNGWTLVNDTDNYFIIGNSEKYKGQYSAFITNDGTTAGYRNNRTRISHFYKDFTFPNADNIRLTLFWKAAAEVNYDYGRVYIMPTSVTPQARVLPNSNYDISGQLNDKTIWTKKEIDLSAYKGTTQRLVFTWRNDSSIGTNPAICFDNILIEYL